MQKLKIKLNFNLFYILLFISSIIYTFVNINFIKINSIYNINTTKIEGYITSYNITDNKLTLILKAKENIIVNYYFKNDKEKKNFNFFYGDTIQTIGKMNIPKENSNFNTFNYRKYLLTKKINYVFEASSIKIKRKNTSYLYKLKNNIINRIEKISTSNYIKTFIIGDKKEIGNDIFSSYQFLGVSHLLAISGMHVSLLSTILLKMLGKLNNNVKFFIISIFLLYYSFITNYTISMLRATLQFILFGINKMFRLEIKNVYIVIFLISILLFYNPYYVYDVGFLFSFSISFSLILFSEKIRNIKNYIDKTFIVSLISFLVSLPILINNFYQVNFLSVIYNIFYVPFVSIIIFPLNLLTLMFPIFNNLNQLFINVFESLTVFLGKIKILTFSCAKIPFSLIIIYYFNLYLLFNRKHKKNILLLIILIIFFIENGKFKLYPSVNYLDVGQGDSILIRIYNKNILIDTGGTLNNKYSVVNSQTLPYLKSVGVKKIDDLILTHGDYDHMGEAINLVNSFKVEKVIFNCGPYNDLEKELIKVLDKKKIKYYSCIRELNIDNNKLHFLQTKEYDNENDNSNVIYTELNGYKFMFMGDASGTTEKEILNKYNLPDIDVLKAGHHGSKTSSSKEFIDTINPKYSIISVGKNNRYGHPNKEALDNLEDSKIYRTDIDGSIMFKIKNNKLKIETCSS